MNPAHHIGFESHIIAAIYDVREDIGLALTGVHVNIHQHFNLGEKKPLNTHFNKDFDEHAGRVVLYWTHHGKRVRQLLLHRPHK